MEKRNKTTIVIASTLFVIVVIGMFTYAYLKRAEIKENVAPADMTIQEEASSIIERIDAKHFFIDGVHTIAGEIMRPTPCDLLDHSVEIMESYPEQVLVNFTIINNAETCAQVVTAQRFLIEFSASEEAEISARLEGRDVILNLIPAAPGETPDSFELFLKG